MARPHAIERQVERMVRMDVRKISPTHKFTQPFARIPISVSLSQPLKTDDADHAPVIADGPRVKFAGFRLFQSLLNRQLPTPYFGSISHRLNHRALPSLLTRLRRGQMNAVLVRQDFVDRLLLKSCGDEKAYQTGNHQRDDDRIIPGDLKNHDHGSHRCADDPREGCTHPYQRIGSRRGSVSWQKMLRHRADNSAQHGPKK